MGERVKPLLTLPPAPLSEFVLLQPEQGLSFTTPAASWHPTVSCDWCHWVGLVWVWGRQGALGGKMEAQDRDRMDTEAVPGAGLGTESRHSHTPQCHQGATVPQQSLACAPGC